MEPRIGNICSRSYGFAAHALSGPKLKSFY
jgi:hypothetical protein